MIQVDKDKDRGSKKERWGETEKGFETVDKIKKNIENKVKKKSLTMLSYNIIQYNQIQLNAIH